METNASGITSVAGRWTQFRLEVGDQCHSQRPLAVRETAGIRRPLLKASWLATAGARTEYGNDYTRELEICQRLHWRRLSVPSVGVRGHQGGGAGFGVRDRECQEFCVWVAVEHQAAMALTKRSPKMTAN